MIGPGQTERSLSDSLSGCQETRFNLGLFKSKLTDNCFGRRLVGMKAMSWPQINSPNPKATQITHWMAVSGWQLNGIPPNCTRITLIKFHLNELRNNDVIPVSRQYQKQFR